MALEDLITRPPLNPTLMQTLGQLQNNSPNFDDLFEQLSRVVLGARQQESGARTAFERELAKGPPRTNPLADAIARSMGSAADLFTGGESGRALAGGTIRDEQNMLLQKRKESLGALEGAYQRAADRAAKLGDFETEMQFLTKRDSTLKNAENISKMLMANAEFNLQRQGAEQQYGFNRNLQELQIQADKAAAQQKFGQDVALQGVREQGDLRTAYINQGLDPDDPTKPLVGSKAQRIRNAAMMGFLSTPKWTAEYFDMVNQGRAGKQDFRGTKLTNRILSLPPDETYAANPDAWLKYLLSLPDPNDRTKYLIPRGRDGFPLPAWSNRVNEHMQRYFPGWNGAVSAIDSVGR